MTRVIIKAIAPPYSGHISLSKFLNISYQVLKLSLRGLQRIEHALRNHSSDTSSKDKIRNKKKLANFQPLYLEP
jgi:hypothetical protein